MTHIWHHGSNLTNISKHVIFLFIFFFILTISFCLPWKKWIIWQVISRFSWCMKLGDVFIYGFYFFAFFFYTFHIFKKKLSMEFLQKIFKDTLTTRYLLSNGMNIRLELLSLLRGIYVSNDLTVAICLQYVLIFSQPIHFISGKHINMPGPKNHQE